MASTHHPQRSGSLPSLLQPVVRAVISQFARPRGPLGAVAGRIMATRGSNVERNLWLVDLLDLRPDHRVLEIGPGPGIALGAMLEVVTAGVVVGVDHSAVMLGQSARRHRRAVEEGRLVLVEATAQALPADLGRFDRICAMNVWHFFEDQEAVVAGLADRLVEGGMLALGHQPRHRGAGAADTDAAGRCLADQLARAGLDPVERHELPLSGVPVTGVTGRR